MRRFAAAALGLLILRATPALSTGGPPEINIRAPILLRLEGQVAATRDAALKTGFTAVSLDLLGDDAHRSRWIGVTEARTLGGDQFVMGKDVLAAVAGFTPNLLVTGPPALVTALRDAPPGTPVRMEGLVDRGSRVYYLRSVRVGAGN